MRSLSSSTTKEPMGKTEGPLHVSDGSANGRNGIEKFSF